MHRVISLWKSLDPLVRNSPFVPPTLHSDQHTTVTTNEGISTSASALLHRFTQNSVALYQRTNCATQSSVGPSANV